MEGRQTKPLKGIVPRTNLNMLTQLCMILDAILADYKVENGDPIVSKQTSISYFFYPNKSVNLLQTSETFFY